MMNTLTLLVCAPAPVLHGRIARAREEHRSGVDLRRHAGRAPRSSSSANRWRTRSSGSRCSLACFLACVPSSSSSRARSRCPIAPFLLTWGLLLVPTFLVWTCFVTAVVSITRNRYATYAVGLVALSLTGWLQFRGKMNWVFNWNLWNARALERHGSVRAGPHGARPEPAARAVPGRVLRRARGALPGASRSRPGAHHPPPAAARAAAARRCASPRSRSCRSCSASVLGVR